MAHCLNILNYGLECSSLPSSPISMEPLPSGGRLCKVWPSGGRALPFLYPSSRYCRLSMETRSNLRGPIGFVESTPGFRRMIAVGIAFRASVADSQGAAFCTLETIVQSQCEWQRWLTVVMVLTTWLHLATLPKLPIRTAAALTARSISAVSMSR